MDDIAIVESFERIWPTLPSGEVHDFHFRNNVLAFGVAFPVYKLQLLDLVVVGERGGLSELTYAIDPEEQIVADRLLLADAPTRGVFLPMNELRRRRKEGEAPESICVEALRDLVARISSNPGYHEDHIRAAARESMRSTLAMSGAGLPSLGKRQ